MKAKFVNLMQRMALTSLVIFEKAVASTKKFQITMFQIVRAAFILVSKVNGLEMNKWKICNDHI